MWDKVKVAPLFVTASYNILSVFICNLEHLASIMACHQVPIVLPSVFTTQEITFSINVCQDSLKWFKYHDELAENVFL